jgi:hypothetical protein
MVPIKTEGELMWSGGVNSWHSSCYSRVIDGRNPVYVVNEVQGTEQVNDTTSRS